MDRDRLVDNEVLDEEEMSLDQSYSISFGSMSVPNQIGNTMRRLEPVEVTDQVRVGVSPADMGQEMPLASSSRSELEVTPTSGEPRCDLSGLNLEELWEINYKEAAIFLEEGVNNSKFTHHPHSHEALPAYLLVQNKWFHLIDLAASLLLLCLGFVEQPCAEPFCVPPQIHGSIELCLLILVAIQVFLKTRWIGWKGFFRHRRTMIKVSTLVVMLIEAVVVLVRSQSHVRVTRALRPIFLVDNHFCDGIRRFIRQILQSLPPIIDMLGLILFVIIIFSVFGFYLFGTDDPDNFGTLRLSFYSLFVLLTTANYPDVMMKSYNSSRWSVFFFIAYLSITLYFLMNLLLAVVYDTFTTKEKNKFKRLFMHKRKAAEHAFNLLVTKDKKDGIKFNSFEGLIKHYRGTESTTEAYLIFKLLNTSNTRYLSMDEFCHVYDACLYKWHLSKVDQVWYIDVCSPFKEIIHEIHKIVTHIWFEYIIYFVVTVNGAILLLQTWFMSDPSQAQAQSSRATWVSYFFVGLYTLEASLKLLGLGMTEYFKSTWNFFDFIITNLGILSLILESLHIPMFFVIILRPLRLLTLFRMKRRYRDVFGTTVILLPRLVSAVIVLLLIYYFFAIIGMECFSAVTLLNCCKNTSIESYFNFDGPEASTNGYFYLNNFESLSNAGVTLFELTVVNNWFVIMDGFAITTQTDWTRLFFMSFYLFTMIVITIVVAFILEAFLFRIQYKQCLTKEEEQKNLSAEITVTSQELEKFLTKRPGLKKFEVPGNTEFKFEGIKPRTKEQLQLMMYTDELDTWIAESRREESQAQARVQAALLKETRNGGRSRTSREAENQIDHDHNLIKVVQDDDDSKDLVTIHRPFLPDVNAGNSTQI